MGRLFEDSVVPKLPHNEIPVYSFAGQIEQDQVWLKGMSRFKDTLACVFP